MSMSMSLMMKPFVEISWDAFNWSSEWYPSTVSQPYFIVSPNWFISTELKTTLTFWPLSILDDFLVMVKQNQTVIQDIDWITYTYTIPTDSIVFFPTYWWVNMTNSDWLWIQYLTDWIHIIWNVSFSWWQPLIDAWFNVKNFSSWIDVSELDSLWFIENNICKFRFYYFASWLWRVNIDTFN